MRNALKQREGFALAVALFAIVVIGGIIAGAFFASNQDYKISRSTLLQERALTAAEFGVNQVINQWNGNWNTQVPTGSTMAPMVYTFPAQHGGLPDQATVTVTRSNQLTFWVVSEGRAGVPPGGDGGARRRVGQVLRLYIPTMNFLAALTVRGVTTVGGSSQISGFDQNPAGWACNAPGAPLPGVATDNLGDLSTQGACAGAACIQGNPQTAQDAAAGSDQTYFDYGGITWDQLVATANKTLAGGPHNNIGPTYNADGSCQTSNVVNWGDANRNALLPGKCEGYFPVLYAPGDLKLNGGKGQGILLVGGNLEVQGGFEFFGPVIVKGSLKTTGTGGHFNGGVMAANVTLEQNVVLGNAVIQYSRCAILAAQMGATLPSRAIQRGWADMF